jgi:hypothetical protein
LGLQPNPARCRAKRFSAERAGGKRENRSAALAMRYQEVPNGGWNRRGYQADSWRHAQLVILVIVDRPDPKTGQMTLEPDHFFLVTSYSAEQRPADERLEHYRKRGTFEDRLGELRQWIGPKLSSQEFDSNEAALLLALLSVPNCATLFVVLGQNWLVSPIMSHQLMPVRLQALLLPNADPSPLASQV